MSVLPGRRILLVEDELLIAMMLEEVLADAGYHVIGPILRLQAALISIETEMIDAALLDMNLAGERVYPAAEMLIKKAIPFVFMTGYGQDALPEAYADRPVVSKPFDTDELVRKLAGLFE